MAVFGIRRRPLSFKLGGIMTDDIYDKQHDDPIFEALKQDDPELQECTKKAKETFHIFLDLYEQYHKDYSIYFAIKVPIVNDDETIHLWYSFQGTENGLLKGEHFQLPKGFEGLKKIKVHPDIIDDWMINDHEILYGGFSLRYQRSLLTEERRPKYDEYMGVSEYRDI
ncbi:domain of unknown function duf2314 [Desulfoluna spongiiphila]|nr:domain of unknown function duf2314 [Desulfoluna spongiiphila]